MFRLSKDNVFHAMSFALSWTKDGILNYAACGCGFLNRDPLLKKASKPLGLSGLLKRVVGYSPTLTKNITPVLEGASEVRF